MRANTYIGFLVFRGLLLRNPPFVIFFFLMISSRLNADESIMLNMNDCLPKTEMNVNRYAVKTNDTAFFPRLKYSELCTPNTKRYSPQNTILTY